MRSVRSSRPTCPCSCGEADRGFPDVFGRGLRGGLGLVLCRISATDWLDESLPDEPSWRSEDTVRLAGILADHGVDLLDVSTGGLHPLQKIKGGPAYQAPFAEAVKKAHGDKILVSTVGAITDGKTAQGCLDKVWLRSGCVW